MDLPALSLRPTCLRPPASVIDLSAEPTVLRSGPTFPLDRQPATSAHTAALIFAADPDPDRPTGTTAEARALHGALRQGGIEAQGLVVGAHRQSVYEELDELPDAVTNAELLLVYWRGGLFPCNAELHLLPRGHGAGGSRVGLPLSQLLADLVALRRYRPGLAIAVLLDSGWGSVTERRLCPGGWRPWIGRALPDRCLVAWAGPRPGSLPSSALRPSPFAEAFGRQLGGPDLAASVAGALREAEVQSSGAVGGWICSTLTDRVALTPESKSSGR